MRRALSLLLLLAACSGEEPAAPTTGSLKITITGLSVPAGVIVRGAAGFTRTISASATIEDMTPGTYTISAPNVVAAGARYAPDQTFFPVQVSASAVPAEATIAYALAARSLTVTVSGLPDSARAEVVVTGPGSFSQALSGTDTLWVPVAGTYTVTAANVLALGKTYVVTPASFTVTVGESSAPVAAAVTYLLASVPFVVTVSGLPDAVPASITVTGPGNFAQEITATTTLWPWLPGSYVIHANDALVSDRTYEPAQANTTVTLTGPPSPVAATVAYFAATVASVTVSPASATASISLTGVQLTASTADARGHVLRNPVTWTSENTSIATVDATGKVRGVSAGTTSVTATADGVSASAVITVPPATTYDLSGRWTFSLHANDSYSAQCSDTGTLDIVQAPSAPGFTATGTQSGYCSARGIGTTISFPQAFQANGTAVGVVSFSLGLPRGGAAISDGCSLVGTPHHEPADNMTGTVSCRLDIGGGNRHYTGTLTGTWSATKVQ